MPTMNMALIARLRSKDAATEKPASSNLHAVSGGECSAEWTYS